MADPALLERDTVELVVQVNGKLRDRLQVPASIGEEELVALARASERVQAHLDGGEPRKTIVVPGKLVNFVRLASVRKRPARPVQAQTVVDGTVGTEALAIRDGFAGTLGTCPPCPCRAGARSCSRRLRSRCSSWPGARWPARVPPAEQPAARSCPSAPRRAPKLVVHVAGAVRRPGPLPAGRGQTSRRRGRPCGRSDRAGRHSRAINLAAPLADGSRCSCPRRGRRRRRRRRAAPARPRGQPQLGDARASSTRFPGIGPVTAQKIVDYRRRARRLPLGRRPRRDPGHRPRARRAAAGARDAVIVRRLPLPTLLVLARLRRPGARERRRARRRSCSRLVAVVAARSRRRRPSARVPAVSRWRSSLAGWWWGERAARRARPQPARRRESAARPRCTVVVTGPVAEDAVRAPRPRRGAPVRRPRAPRARPARAAASAARRRRAPSSPCAAGRRSARPEDGFDERGWLARRGVHVVAARRRLADRRPARRASAASPTGSVRMSRARSPLGSTASGARVLAGIVLGEDEGLSDELRDNFKASGLYHLLAVSGQNVAFLALGRARARLAARDPAARGRGRRDRRDRRLRARRRLAALGRARRRRRRARLARVARCSRPRDRWHFLAARRGRPARLDAGEPARAGLPALVRGRRRRSSCCVPRLGWRSRATRCPAARATRSRSRPRAGPPRRRSSGSSSGACRSTRCWRTRSSRSRSAPLLGLALVGSLLAAAAAVGGARARVAERLARRLPRGLRAARRRAAARPDRLRHGGLRRCSGRRSRCSLLQRLPRWRRPAALACAATLVAGAARLAALSRRDAAAADRAPDHVPRRRAGRRDPAPGAGGRGARRPGPARGGRRAAAPRARRPAARRARAHAPAARPHRRRRRRCPPARRRPRARSAARRSRARTSAAALAAAAERGVAGRRDARRRRFRLGRLRLRVLWPDRAGHAGRGSEPAPDRPARDLRRGRRAPDRGRRDRRHRAAALAAGRDPQGRAPRLGRLRASRASCASCGRPSRSSPAAADNDYGHPRARRSPRSARARAQPLTAPTRTGGSWSSRTGARITVRTDR